MEGRKSLTSVRLRQFTWLAIAAATLLLILLAIPARLAVLSTVVPPLYHDLGQPTLEDALELTRMGLSTQFYARLFTALEVAGALAFLALSGVIAWRRSDDSYAAFAACVLAPFGAVSTPLLDTLAALHPGWSLPVALARLFGLGGGMILLYTFPNGRFIPRWTRLASALWLAYLGAALFIPGLRFLPSLIAQKPGDLLILLVVLLLLGSVVFVQVYRYRRLYGPVQRQQAKWVVYGFSIFISLTLLVSLPLVIGRLIGQSGLDLILFHMIAFTVVLLGQVFFVFMFVIALLRSSLWDINLVVRRTLSYTILSLILVGIYGLAVVLIQSAFSAFGGEWSEYAIAASTLLIAALFNPLRQRIQQRIDRAFHRQKYDHDQVLARFAAGLSDELDPETLCARLVAAVDEALQPEAVTVWLAPDARSESR